jgi:shikimate kinase/3-dehydroquinate synthase
VNVTIPKAVVIGMPLSGKTRFGKALSNALDLPFADLDALLEDKIGMAINDVFAEQGEAFFRDEESKLLREQLLAFEGVLSTGGGAVVMAENQQLLQKYRQAGGVVIYLNVDAKSAEERVTKKSASRPLLHSEAATPWQRWLNLFDERQEIYNDLADLTLQVGRVEAEELVQEILPSLGARRVRVVDAKSEKLKYSVVIGQNIFSEITSTLTSRLSGGDIKALVMHTAPTLIHAQEVQNVLQSAGAEVLMYQTDDAEAAKTLHSYEQALQFLAQQKFSRCDIIVGVGGGALTDFAGFVASSYLRGVDYVNVPTSLLAMVDASTGGKTGINLPQGKNLVGAFYEPLAVYCDITTLETLGEREFIEGLGEVAKIGLTFDPVVLERLSTVVPSHIAISAQLKGSIAELIYRSVQVKARVVGEDFYDTGIREYLNYGHTLGHIIEKSENFEIRHGEAVAIGMVFVAKLAYELGLLELTALDKHYEVLEKCGLPTTWQHKIPFEEMRELLMSDKKSRGSKVRLVCLSGMQAPFTLEDPDDEALATAYAEL